MGIAAVLQDERCNNISEMIIDPEGVMSHCIPGPSDGAYSCVRFIDPYGDTIFNSYQATVMIGEWDRLKQAFAEYDAEALWANIRGLIVRCSGEPHTFLRFIGD